MTNSFLKHLYQFAEKNEISYQEMRRRILEAGRGGYPVTVYATKLDGTNRVFDNVTTTDGPGGKAMGGCIYWKAPYYYMIVDESEVGFRTIVLKNVSKIKINGKAYIVNQ